VAAGGPEVVLVRHGETEWSRDGRHTGATDIPLTDTGREQAAALGRALAGRAFAFALVLVSPLGRARATCELAGLGDAAQVCDDLREWDYGDYEGITTAEIQRRAPGWHLFSDGCPGGETPAQVAARADRVIARARAAGGDVALFGHGHCLRMLTARWLGLPPRAGARFGLHTGTLGTLGWEHGRAALWLWNAPAP
jgi:probable phosphoglycerate mutase